MKKILNVPFVKQKLNYCGPASLAMVFQYHGYNVNQDFIGEKIPGGEYFGITLGELEGVSKENGFETKILEKCNFKDLISLIDKNCPHRGPQGGHAGRLELLAITPYLFLCM